jgi:methylated-DNA-protein-cysteine methyltransferase-like protein
VNFREAVAALVSRIPEGRVMTYGQVAASLGLPRAARAVGSALHHLPNPAEVPWWRVINREGRISTRCFDHPADYQRRLLLDEGVIPDDDGAIALDRYRWWPSPEDEAACRVSTDGLARVGEAIQPRRALGRRSGRSSSPARRTWSGTSSG